MPSPAAGVEGRGAAFIWSACPGLRWLHILCLVEVVLCPALCQAVPAVRPGSLLSSTALCFHHAARAGSVAPAASAQGPAGSRDLPAAGSPDLQQVQHASPGVPGLTQLSGGLAAASSSLGAPGVARRRLPPRRPGTPSPWAVAAAANAAAAAAVGAGPAAALAAGAWAPPAAGALQAGHQLGPLGATPSSAGAPAAAAAAVAPSGSSGLLGAAGGGLSTAAAPADAAEGTDGTGVAAGGASAAEPGRQERLDGLLHRDANAAFPAGLPDGAGRGRVCGGGQHCGGSLALPCLPLLCL